MKKSALILILAIASATPLPAQKSAAPSRVAEVARQPVEAANLSTPPFRGVPQNAVLGEGKPAEAVPAKDKGPTEIDSLEATFDQKANVAVFIGEVVVKDPEFNVKCDKLTAHLKPAETSIAPVAPPGPKAAKSATPSPTPPKSKGGGGLKNAIAEMNPGGRVVITQDKPQADGTIQHSVGTGEKATYDAVSGDIVLIGKPEIQQGINLIIATAQSTRMTLNRDGHMRANGPTKTVIVDKAASGL